MRYFHRTSLPPDDALALADEFFGSRTQTLATVGRRRTFRHAGGTVTIDVRVEGGHYTLVTVTTDQVGESEVDKLAKRFLAGVHAATHQQHQVRGAY
jgi:hypothetical protein